MLERDNSPPAWGFGKERRDNINRKDRDLANVSPFSYNKGFHDRKSESKWSMG